LADGCAASGLRFYLGHALYMKAISGHKRKSDPLDAETIANLLRTSYFPEAYPYPKEMRPTRDLLRRRHRLVRLRSESYTHIQLVCHQYGITDVATSDIRDKDRRDHFLGRFRTDDIITNIQTDLDLIDVLTPVIHGLEALILKQARHHRHLDYALLQTVPGVGQMIALNLIYEIHDIHRFKTVQRFSSYCRVVKCERSSNGKSKGRRNQKIGNPYLKWGLSQIIVNGKKIESIGTYASRLESKYGIRRARAQLAHEFAVAIYYMLKHGKPFDEERFLS
jgi:transposase